LVTQRLNWFGSILIVRKTKVGRYKLHFVISVFFLKFKKLKIYSMKKHVQKLSLLFITFLLSNSKLNAQAGAGLSFDGTDDRVVITTTTALVMNDFTMEFWMQHTGADAGFDRITSTASDLFETAKDGSGNIKYYMGSWITVTSMPINTWTHLAWVRKGNNLTLYKNGVFTYSAVVSTALMPTQWQLGQRVNGPGECANMSMDEFRVWNRALCQGEIQNNMNCEIPTTGSGLIVNYHFNNGTAGGTNTGLNTVNDFSGNTINGALQNFALAGASSNWIAPGGVTSGVSCGAFSGPVVTSVSGTQQFCLSGSSALTVSSTASSPVFTWYATPTGTTPINSGANYTTPTLTNTTTYYVDVASLGCNSATRTAVTVTINPLPTVVANTPDSVFCPGDSAIFFGSGASTYTWSGGVIDNTGFIISSSGIYTLSGTDLNGCTNSTVLSVTVNPLPTVSASAIDSVLCNGDSTIVNGSGALTYTWTGGVTNGTAFYPGSTTTYTVMGTDANGCTNWSVQTITVNPLPTLTFTTTVPLLCIGQTATITASGASTYTWNTSANTAAIVVSPTTSTTYTVDVTDVNGCMNTGTFIQNVSLCIGIANQTISNEELICYPNPNNGAFSIRSAFDINLSVVNELGSLIKTISLNESNDRQIRISDLSSGLYFIVGQNNGKQIKQKIVVSE
jgi:hypothetical protein